MLGWMGKHMSRREPELAKRRPDIACLTSLRFFAAMLVFGRHMFFFEGHATLETIYTALLKEGYIGVTFFFVLSGFILTYNYLDKFKEVTWVSLRKFYQARLARIYPVHLLTFYFAIAFELKNFEAAPGRTIAEGLLNITLLHGFSPVGGRFNGPSWSLTPEMVFYILVPFIWWAVCRFQVGKRCRRPVMLMAGGWGLYVLGTYLIRNAPYSWWWLYYFPLTRMADFIMGVLAAVIFMRGGLAWHRGREARLFTYLEFGCVFVFAVLYLLSAYVYQSWRFSVYYLPIMTAMIFVFAWQRGKVSGWLQHKELIFLGEISFSFYMIHRLVIKFFQSIAMTDSHPLVVGLLVFVITVVLSVIIYHYVENPLRFKLRRVGIGGRANFAWGGERGGEKKEMVRS